MLRAQLTEFNHIMQGIDKIYEDYAKSVGLTYMSMVVLEIIYHSELPLTQREVCEQSHYNKQVVNSIIKNFYEKGYVSLQEVPNDRRNKHIFFTESGKKYADAILLDLWEIEKKALSVLSEEERSSMLEMLRRCFGGYKSAIRSNQDNDYQ